MGMLVVRHHGVGTTVSVCSEEETETRHFLELWGTGPMVE